MIVVYIVIPILSGILYRMTGTDWAWVPEGWFKKFLKFMPWRELIGTLIGGTFAIITKSWIPLICILTFWFQPPYGANSYLNFLGEIGKFAVCGFVFGVSSIPVWIALNLWWMGLVQAGIAALAFVIVKYLDDHEIVKNPWVEILRGLLGTILL